MDMNRPSLALASFCLLSIAGSQALGQQYAFLPVPGSPKNVKALYQDSRGLLWLGGADVSCFDGTRFFSLRDYGFPPVESYDITEDSSGAIWIGAETGVYRFAGGRVEEIGNGVAVSVIAATPGFAIAAVGPLGKGIPTNASLIRMRRTGTAWRTETVMSLDSPGPLTLDPSGVLLYPSSTTQWNEMRIEDVVRWRPGTRIAATLRGASGGDPVNGGWQIMRDHSGCLWGAAPGASYYNCGDGPHPAPFPGANVQAPAHEASDGTIVLHGNSLLAIGRPGSFQIATRANGLPGILDAIQARDGTVWLATTNGLYRFASPFRVEYWTIREGLPDPPGPSPGSAATSTPVSIAVSLA